MVIEVTRKEGLPFIGEEGIPLRGEIEFETEV